MKTKNDICKMLIELIKERDKINTDIRFCIDHQHNNSSGIESHYKNLLESLNFYNGKISALHWVLE